MSSSSGNSSVNLYAQGGGTASSSQFPTSPVVQPRDPSALDIKGTSGFYPVGKQWINSVTGGVFALVTITSSNGRTSATWSALGAGSGSLDTLSGNTGTATPFAGNIQIEGTGDISVTGSGDTLSIAVSGGSTVISQIDTDSGSANPVDGIINVTGIADQIETAGSGDTVTIGITDTITSDSLTTTGFPVYMTNLGVGAGETGATYTTAVGYNALHINSTTENTAVGAFALASTDVLTGLTAVGFSALASSTGIDNTALGHKAGFENSNGIFNTYIGKSAGEGITSAEGVTAVGAYSLLNCTSNSTTAVGYQALSLLTSAQGCTAVGGFAANVNTAANCSAFGTVALGSNTTGANNSAFGAFSLTNCVTGANNSGFGYQTLESTLSSGNSAFGTSALTVLSSGANCTAVGSDCLSACTTGARNTSLGQLSGTLVVSGNDNVFLGRSAGSAFTGSDSNNITIGSGVTGASGVSNTVIIGADATFCAISGIRGATTINNDAVAVLVDSSGQLGTISSSGRFKENIRDMDDFSGRIFDLRPVLFDYKTQNSSRPHVGLIAEEVHEVLPEIVVMDKEGIPETIQYHSLIPLLLNELIKLKKEVTQLRARN